MEPAATTGKEAASSILEHFLAVRTVTSAAEDKAGTVIESDSGDTQHKAATAVESRG